MATKKSAKKTAKKIDFKDSVKAIRETAKTVNTKVKTVADEVTEDLMENGGHFKDYAMASAKEAYNKAYDKVNETVEKVAENVTIEKISKTAKNINDYTLKTADELVDSAYENGEKWQGIATKAVKGSLKLAGKQQEIVFDTLDTVKGQLTNTVVRVKKLFFN